MVAQPVAAPSPRPQTVLSDRAFSAVLGIAALTVTGLVVLLGVTLARGAAPALHHFGWRFLTGMNWDPVALDFGALPFIFGTLATSILALLIAVPVGLGTAVFLAEIAPAWLAQPVSFLVELLAAVPSVVYGMWCIFIGVPLLQKLETWVGNHPWGDFWLFEGPPVGIGLLAATLILAIMILPFIASVARDAIRAVPRSVTEAGLAMGTTRWETLRGPVLRYARRGILGGVILALGRALGETMAVTMVIGNNPQITASLFRSAYTMSAVLANEFAEANDDLHRGTLVGIAVVLLVLTVLVNGVARLMIWGSARGEGGAR